MHKKYAQLRHQAGFNLVEAAIVLGVIGLVIGGIWVAAANVSRQQRLDELTRTISLIQNNLIQLYGSNHPAFGTSVIISGQLLREITPSSAQLNSDNTAILDPLGGHIYVYILPEAIQFSFGHNDFQPYCREVANRLNTAFGRASPKAYMLYAYGREGNVVGGANDGDLSSVAAVETNCPNEDGVMLFLGY